MVSTGGGPIRFPDLASADGWTRGPVGKAAANAGQVFAAQPHPDSNGATVRLVGAQLNQTDGASQGGQAQGGSGPSDGTQAAYEPGLVRRTGEGLARGAITAAATLVRGAGALAAKGAANMDAVQRAAIDRIDRGETVLDAEDPAGYQYMSPAQQAEYKAQLALPPVPLKDTGAFRAADAMRDFGNRQFPRPTDAGFYTDLVEAAGGAAPVLAAGALTGGAGALAGGAAVLATGGVMGAGTAAETAQRNGGTDADIEQAALYGVPVGMLTDGPVGRWLKPLNAAPGFKQTITLIGQKLVERGVLPGTTAAVQQFGQNLIEKYGTNPSRDVLDGLVQAFGVQAVLGVGASAAGKAAVAGRPGGMLAVDGNGLVISGGGPIRFPDRASAEDWIAGPTGSAATAAGRALQATALPDGSGFTVQAADARPNTSVTDPDGTDADWVRPQRWILPRTNGRWEGTPGHSDWISYNDEVNAITGGKPIPFKNGFPDFSQWAQDSFEVDGLTGQPGDFPLIWDEIAKRKELGGRIAGRRYLRDNELSPHHHEDGRTIQLVPRALNDNVPHIGGAALSRRNE